MTGRRACVYLKGMRVCLFSLSLCLLLLASGPSGGAGPAGTLSVFSTCGVAHAAQTSRKQPQKRRAKKKKAPLHGESWAFGQSATREDALWKKGVEGETLHHRATGGSQKAPAVGNTASIEASLRREAERQKKDEERRRRGGLGMSLDTDDSVWRPQTPGAPGKPDETLSIGNPRHTLRAFGGVRSDDLSISVGPEITVKDKEHGGHFAHSDEPDSAVGMGMRFSLDF